MTDEEKAEEYVENKYHCNRSECIQGNSCDYCYREESKRDYLAGLAEGKPKWHDLRKDPSDLPKENGKYIIHIIVSERISITDTCDFFNGSFGRFFKPIAWCELPKFEK